MNSATKILKLYSLISIFHIGSSMQYDCSRSEYNRCVQIADPLVKEAHLIFPDNLDDIDLVCRTWNKFVDCLKRYTDRCFTDQQRLQFNKAVENPIESVHQMCMQPPYQKEYLKHAPCIKSTITERSHCGPQYSLLVDQVAQGEVISRNTLCCSHDRFKQCVLRETRRLCDRGANGQASVFASQIIDKALSFLADQCTNYIPNSGDCHTYTSDSISYNDPIMISTSPSEVYPWSTIHDLAPKEIIPSKVSPPKVATVSWLPSSSISSDSSTHSDPSSTQLLGSRTRPASYGRSSSWQDSPVNTQPGINSIYTHLETASTQSSRPDWATVSSWNVVNNQNPGLRPDIRTENGRPENGRPENGRPESGRPDNGGYPNQISGTQYPSNSNQYPGNSNQYPGNSNPYPGNTNQYPGNQPGNRPATNFPGSSDQHPKGSVINPYEASSPAKPSVMSSTETWYPAAGNQIDNEVDEPNQQGLKKPKNSAMAQNLNLTVLTVLTILVISMLSSHAQ